MAITYYAADYAYGINPQVEWAIAQSGSNAAGAAGTFVVNQLTIPTAFGRQFVPFNVNGTITVDGQDTVAPTTVAQNTPLPGQTSVTATLEHAHGKGATISSGTVGLQEAINDAATRTNGGTVIIDGQWAFLGGTSAMVIGAGGYANVQVLDMRGGTPGWYTWNGTSYVGSPNVLSGPNGESFVSFHNSELLTLNTGGLTTDTAGLLLPANSLIMMVTGYVQTTITGPASWQLGDATTAGRFSAVNAGLTAGNFVPTTAIPPVQVGTGIASATTGMWQLLAAKVRVTCTTTNPSAGKIRIDTYGFTVTLPTS